MVYDIRRSEELLKIIALLNKNEQGLNVNQIKSLLNKSQSVISEQLTALEQQGLINKQRKGKNLLLTLNRVNLNKLVYDILTESNVYNSKFDNNWINNYEKDFGYTFKDHLTNLDELISAGTIITVVAGSFALALMQKRLMED